MDISNINLKVHINISCLELALYLWSCLSSFFLLQYPLDRMLLDKDR